MFEIGFTEILMIGLVALLFVKPDRYPEMVRTIGYWLGRIQRVAREMRAEFDRDVGRAEIARLQQDLHQTSQDFQQAAHTPPAATPTAVTPGEPRPPGTP